MTDPTNAERSTLAGLGNSNLTEPPALDVERQPMPDRTPETTSDENTQPPLRLGPASQAPVSPTEGEPDTNPVHHTGHMPPPVTANRE